ncbi:MAG: HAMP domain-containing protein, partial [Bdellovibrionales bacterium]|nr:HAMP domain-containing protein [Bdellovibrionales bacterium]
SFGVSVVAQIPEEVILEPAKQVQREAYYAGGLVLSVALFFVFLFSISLTSPIEKLLELTVEVAKGNFDIDAAGKIKSRDEVNDLAQAFDKMTTGLKALVKTQGADVAKTLMETDFEKMGGSKKQVAVLFSDLRDFTKFSEGHTPEEVVEMLNEYFEVMVGCIERNKGRVNKFIGDAIMAMWGAPSSTGNDEVGAVRAALEMRIDLKKLNDRRLARGDSPIKIGVGIHCGEAVAGTIGSKSRLEYTIIGDTVNQASRLEASTKAFGSDLLISEETMEKVKDSFMIEYAGSAEVKGKAEALKMYRVRGFIHANGTQEAIRTLYSDFEASDADKVKVSSPEPADHQEPTRIAAPDFVPPSARRLDVTEVPSAEVVIEGASETEASEPVEAAVAPVDSGEPVAPVATTEILPAATSEIDFGDLGSLSKTPSSWNGSAA